MLKIYFDIYTIYLLSNILRFVCAKSFQTFKHIRYEVWLQLQQNDVTEKCSEKLRFFYSCEMRSSVTIYTKYFSPTVFVVFHEQKRPDSVHCLLTWTRNVSGGTSRDHERWTEASNPLLVGISALEKEVMEQEGQGRERERERGIREQRGRWTETWFTPI